MLGEGEGEGVRARPPNLFDRTVHTTNRKGPEGPQLLCLFG